MKKILLITFIFSCSQALCAAEHLSKLITIQVDNERLGIVLAKISHKGNFYFSYNSSLFKRDSLVSLHATQQKVKEILDNLFNRRFEYKESGNYIIIRPKPEVLTIQTKTVPVNEKFYTVQGYITDGDNGLTLPDVSVYEKSQLISVLSDYNGFFSIKLKSKYPKAMLSFSREWYGDTVVSLKPSTRQDLQITLYSSILNNVVITPQDYLYADSLDSYRLWSDTLPAISATPDSLKTVESGFLERWFVSTRQKVQSLNLGDWFTERPFQLSVTPGLSTQGKMSGQVINNFSLNVFGGYTGGLKGVEFGGFFNLNRRDVNGFQVGGLFNHSGGKQTGFQVAGLSNSNLGSGKGFQTAGVVNYNRLGFSGFQAAGVANVNVENNFSGFQAAGVYNHAAHDVTGIQVAGVSNFANRNLKGIQIAGVFNHAKHNKGLQIGLINYADTSDGFSIGLINIVKRGYHKWYSGTDETMDLATSIKTGNRKLYSILLAGMNLNQQAKLYSFGYGLGSEWILKRAFALSTDLSSQFLYLGSWDYVNLLNRLSLNLHLKFSKHFAIYGGPSFNVFYSNQTVTKPGYATNIPANGYARFSWNNQWSGWGGWQAGIALF